MTLSGNNCDEILLEQFVDQLFIMALWAVDLEMVPAGDIISYAM